MSGDKIRVLVVDDTIFYRKLLTNILGKFPEIEVVGAANTGEMALLKIRDLKPELVTLDIEMPYMDGLQVLRHAKVECLPVDFVIVSGRTVRGGAITIEALERGAFDFITKPDTDDKPGDCWKYLTEEFARVLEAFKRRQVKKGQRPAHLGEKNDVVSVSAPQPAQSPAPGPRCAPLSPTISRKFRADVIAIGVSTGGPNTLATLLPALPAAIGVPILLVQHMPPVFTASLAQSLDLKCKLTVKEGVDSEKVEPDTVYIAPGGRQMKVIDQAGHKILQITDDPPENSCRPAVDYLFRSVTKEYGGRVTCVILTGMGEDGKKSCAAAKEKGAFIIAQDESTSVVYGMPRAVVDAGLADVVAPLPEIAAAILKTLVR